MPAKTPTQARSTCETLFRGAEKNLKAARDAITNGLPARDVADRHIQPVIEKVNRNAGQEMLPTYLAYFIEWAYGGK